MKNLNQKEMFLLKCMAELWRNNEEHQSFIAERFCEKFNHTTHKKEQGKQDKWLSRDVGYTIINEAQRGLERKLNEVLFYDEY